uniref:Uncharacterized protein n=1 Tax=Arundo donax TaxID=35708 RepID=A0A0A9AAG1_ARUDO
MMNNFQWDNCTSAPVLESNFIFALVF